MEELAGSGAPSLERPQQEPTEKSSSSTPPISIHPKASALVGMEVSKGNGPYAPTGQTVIPLDHSETVAEASLNIMGEEQRIGTKPTHGMEVDENIINDQVVEPQIKSSPAEEAWTEDSKWETTQSGSNADPKSGPRTEPAPVSDRQLNVGDALYYLDAVKKQFQDSPEVYNKFLDIMKDFKNQSIDTPGVIKRVSSLFAGYPGLIEGFNTFLPPGYRIECSVISHDMHTITVTTPDGTTTLNQVTDSHLEDVPYYTTEQITPAMEYVSKIKRRFEGNEEGYQEFLDILNTYQRSPVDQDLIAPRIQKLFQNSPDLLSGLQHFLPYEMFANLDATVLDKDGRGPKAGKKRVETVVPTASSSGMPKRKRKAPVREKDREQENDTASKAAHTKSKKGKQLQPNHDASYAYPEENTTRTSGPSYSHVAPSGSSRLSHSYDSSHLEPSRMPSQDDMAFFERVRVTIDNRDVYNEFLKLVNLFTQEIIDMRKLVERSRTFLNDDLLAQFKEILGWDATWETILTGPSGTTIYNNEGLERLTKESLSIRHGPSYRRLPASEVNVACSGRDDMCKSVLNDEWVSHPTWASEDSGFVAHKKNVYEEALHRSEEERHEYDFHVDAITRTIASLEPFYQKIMQLPPEERSAPKHKMPLHGINKAIHQRVIKKVYGREAGLEVLQAMHDVPSTAIPIVYARLKQKEEEWRKAQREWNKVWREVDALNYQKSLDHQGVNFKTNDKKAVSTKTLVNQIESARDEQMSKRASLIDPLFARTRPRYQMAFHIEDQDVINDLFKLTFSLLDRMQHHITIVDRRRIEGFLRSFIPLFLMLDPAQFNASFQGRNATVDPDFFNDDFANFIDENDEVSLTGSSSRTGRTARRGTDLRKKLLKSNAQQDKNRKASHNQARATRSSPSQSDSSVPMIVDDDPIPEHANTSSGERSRQQDVFSDSPEDGNRTRPQRRGTFFANVHFYCLIRLIQILYSRLLTCKELSLRLASDPSSPYLNNILASELVLLDTEAPDPKLAQLHQTPSPAAHFYSFLLESCERLFDNEIDQQSFEDITRHMFGTKAYIMFTVDKVISAIVKQVQNIISDNKSLVLLEGLKRERELSMPSTLDLDEIKSAVEKVVAPEENLFRLDWTPSSHILTIQLLGKDDAVFDDLDVYTGRWQSYIQSFVTDNITRGMDEAKVKPPFLTRNYRAVKKAPIALPSYGHSGLEIKICVRTYRMFFVSETEDTFYRAWNSKDIEDTERRSTLRISKSRDWMTRLDSKGDIP